MSAFRPIASGLPSASDVDGTPGERLKVTLNRHTAKFLQGYLIYFEPNAANARSTISAL